MQRGGFQNSLKQITTSSDLDKLTIEMTLSNQMNSDIFNLIQARRTELTSLPITFKQFFEAAKSNDFQIINDYCKIAPPVVIENLIRVALITATLRNNHTTVTQLIKMCVYPNILRYVQCYMPPWSNTLTQIEIRIKKLEKSSGNLPALYHQRLGFLNVHEDEISTEFKCPISKRVMDFPIKLADNCIYDLISLVTLFLMPEKTPEAVLSPATGAMISIEDLFREIDEPARGKIEEFIIAAIVRGNRKTNSFLLNYHLVASKTNAVILRNAFRDEGPPDKPRESLLKL